MASIDLMVIEPWDYNHYNHIPPFLCKLLSNSKLKVGVTDYLNKLEKRGDYRIFDNFSFKPPPKIKVSNFLEDIKNFYNFYNLNKRLINFSSKKTNNFIFTTGSEPLFLLPRLKNLNFILYLHRPSRYNKKKNKTIHPLKILRKIARKRGLRLCEAIITTEVGLKKEFKTQGIEKPIYTIPRVHPNNSIIDIMKKEVSPNHPNEFNLLTIGIIRKSKNIDFIYNVLKHTDYNLTIAGNPKGKYGEKIKKISKKDDNNNIKFILQYLENKKYQSLIRNSSFVVFSHEMKGGAHTSGPMIDALLNYRPFIAPDKYPFNYYANKFGVGITYEEKNRQSLLDAVQKAESKGAESFQENIKKLIDQKFDYDKLAKKMESICRRHFEL